MKCQDCKRDFQEKEIHTSHDVPCYLFYDLKSRREKKQFADKLGRHYLCIECHEKYEKTLNSFLKDYAKEFCKVWFKK